MKNYNKRYIHIKQLYHININFKELNGEDNYAFSCMFSPNPDGILKSVLMKAILIVFGLILPLFYLKIYSFLKHSKSKAISNYVKTDVFLLDFEFYKGILYSCLFFSITYFSYSCLVFTRNFENYFTVFIFKYLFLIAHSNPLLNPIIYATTNSMFRNAYSKMFPFFYPKDKPREVERVVEEQEMVEI